MKNFLIVLAVFGLGFSHSVLAEEEETPDFATYDCATNFPETLLKGLVPDLDQEGKFTGKVGDKLSGDEWNQKRLDLLYSCLDAGPIPEGFHHGDVIFPDQGGHVRFIEVANKLGVPLTRVGIEKLATTLWKGKRFTREQDGTTSLLNRLDIPLPPLVDKFRFPAKVYHGISTLDVRKDATIIDYAFSEDFATYFPQIDDLATRRGLLIRDEIRQIVPGLYLGRAHLKGIFVLNFILFKAAN